MNFQQKNVTTWHTYLITGVIKYMRLVFIAYLLNVRAHRQMDIWSHVIKHVTVC